jgi:hypothetical protein
VFAVREDVMVRDVEWTVFVDFLARQQQGTVRCALLGDGAEGLGDGRKVAFRFGITRMAYGTISGIIIDIDCKYIENPELTQEQETTKKYTDTYIQEKGSLSLFILTLQQRHMLPLTRRLVPMMPP